MKHHHEYGKVNNPLKLLYIIFFNTYFDRPSNCQKQTVNLSSGKKMYTNLFSAFTMLKMKLPPNHEYNFCVSSRYDAINSKEEPIYIDGLNVQK